MEAARLDEESKGLLRRIVERTAYRRVMAANIRGHGLKYVTEVATKQLVVRDLEDSLVALGRIEELYAAIGGADLLLAVRDLMERVPYPYSRLELAVCLEIVDRTERLVAEAYVDSVADEMARLARSMLGGDRPGTLELEKQLAAFCAEPGNRPAAQQFVNRWLAIGVVAFGRPRTSGDQRALALGLRKQSCETMVRRFLDELRPKVESWGLFLPPPAALGIEGPPEGAKHAAHRA